MEKICLQKIEKANHVLRFAYSVTEGLSPFFADKPFQIEYPFSITEVPDCIAAIPFVCNVLPLVWLSDAELTLPELDEDFFNCIPEVKKGYSGMYPDCHFGGRLSVGELISPSCRADRCAMFYSAGVDSMQTLIRHAEERPYLFAVWGSDIRYDNSQGWENMHQAIREAADYFGLDEMMIHSTFREFDREGRLDQKFSALLQDGWWHGIKHSLALLGHMAPAAYLLGIKWFYIASSNCDRDKEIRCASNPETDNHVRFAGCQVIHDGFQYSRQDKVRNIVHYFQGRHTALPLHVCWKTQTGKNCGRCEKCYRTMCAIAAESGDPTSFGFPRLEHPRKIMNVVLSQVRGTAISKTHWQYIKERVLQNKALLRQQPSWRSLKWMLRYDFSQPDTITIPIETRVKRAAQKHKLLMKLYHKVRSIR